VTPEDEEHEKKAEEFSEDSPTHAERDPAVPEELLKDLPSEELAPSALAAEFDTSEAAFVPPRLESIVESLLFAADKPLSLKALGELLGESDLTKVREVVSGLETHYTARGIQLHSVAGGFQFRTHPENARWVQKLLAQKPVRLTRAQLETLAIVSYRQPITRPEIDEIRGVDSGGTLKTLMDRSLIRILGKKEEPGRPMLYGTTKDFLEFFNLSDLKDLPTLREFHELTEEHQAQVDALASVAPEGSIDDISNDEETMLAEAAKRPLERVNLTAPPEDAEELDEIDRLITTAGANLAPDPLPPPDTEKPET
jgi:segregation and condensation protein B